MTREETLYCMKANSVLHSEICEECPFYGDVGVDHCFEDALYEVIKALEQEPCKECKYNTNPRHAVCNSCICGDRFVKDEALEQEPTWIPVSERLPKPGEYIGDVPKYYLVQNEYGDMLVASYTHSEYWMQIHQLKPIGDKIIAWMPLPEPYKAESEDKE